jgi:hypothetical protein
MQKFLKFITWRLCTAQHVSGVLTPNIGAQQLQLQPLVLPSYRGCSSAVGGGRASPTTTNNTATTTLQPQVINLENFRMYLVDLLELFDDACTCKF